MEEIELSVMSYTPERVEMLKSLLAEFEANNHVRVHIQTLTWESSWSEILKFVFQGHGPVVSEVGNTWVTSLARMNSLRPFKEEEIAAMGGEQAFLPNTWQAPSASNDPIWSIPWLAESRVILYRRDLLEAAGVDETAAFETHQQLEKTLSCLMESIGSKPWIVPTGKTANTLHNLPGWIWGAGGDYVDRKQRRVTVADPAAVRGIREYFSLYRFLAKEHGRLDPYQAETLFSQGHGAVTINGPWAVFPPAGAQESAITDKVGVAPLPGIHCVLASNLVIWKHTPVRLDNLALKLVKFLTAKEPQWKSAQHAGLIPARLETLEMPPFSTNPDYQVFVNALKDGRPLPTMRLWGLLEERLTTAFANLWQNILSTPDPDLDALIKAELDPLAQKLNRILE